MATSATGSLVGQQEEALFFLQVITPDGEAIVLENVSPGDTIMSIRQMLADHPQIAHHTSYAVEVEVGSDVGAVRNPATSAARPFVQAVRTITTPSGRRAVRVALADVTELIALPDLARGAKLYMSNQLMTASQVPAAPGGDPEAPADQQPEADQAMETAVELLSGAVPRPLELAGPDAQDSVAFQGRAPGQSHALLSDLASGSDAPSRASATLRLETLPVPVPSSPSALFGSTRPGGIAPPVSLAGTPATLPRCVGQITYSPWHPPPPQRALLGDLAYLVTETLEGVLLHITATPDGFLVNASTGNPTGPEAHLAAFDPRPKQPLTRSFTLHGLLKKVSPLYVQRHRALLERAKSAMTGLLKTAVSPWDALFGLAISPALSSWPSIDAGPPGFDPGEPRAPETGSSKRHRLRHDAAKSIAFLSRGLTANRVDPTSNLSGAAPSFNGSIASVATGCAFGSQPWLVGSAPAAEAGSQPAAPSRRHRKGASKSRGPAAGSGRSELVASSQLPGLLEAGDEWLMRDSFGELAGPSGAQAGASFSAHLPSPDRAEDDLLATYGTDDLGMSRDFNEEMQSCRELPTDTLADRIVRARAITKVRLDFVEAAVRGAVAICKGYVSCLNPADNPLARVFVFNSIFYSLAFDESQRKRATDRQRMADELEATAGGAADVSNWNFFSDPTLLDAAALASSNHDLQGVVSLQRADVAGLHTLLTAVIDYGGERLVAQSIIPGILQGEAASSLVYGSVDDGKAIAKAPEVHELMLKATQRLGLAARVTRPTMTAAEAEAEAAAKASGAAAAAGGSLVGMDSGAAGLPHAGLSAPEPPVRPRKWRLGEAGGEMVGPVECKGIRGADGRVYVLDLVRVTPRDAEWYDLRRQRASIRARRRLLWRAAACERLGRPVVRASAGELAVAHEELDRQQQEGEASGWGGAGSLWWSDSDSSAEDDDARAARVAAVEEKKKPEEAASRDVPPLAEALATAALEAERAVVAGPGYTALLRPELTTRLDETGQLRPAAEWDEKPQVPKRLWNVNVFTKFAMPPELRPPNEEHSPAQVGCIGGQSPEEVAQLMADEEMVRIACRTRTQAVIEDVVAQWGPYDDRGRAADNPARQVAGVALRPPAASPDGPLPPRPPGALGMPADGAELTESLHARGLNVRSLGRIARRLSERAREVYTHLGFPVGNAPPDDEEVPIHISTVAGIPDPVVPAIAMLETEMVARVARQQLASHLRSSHRVILTPAPAIALFLSSLLGAPDQPSAAAGGDGAAAAGASAPSTGTPGKASRRGRRARNAKGAAKGGAAGSTPSQEAAALLGGDEAPGSCESVSAGVAAAQKMQLTHQAIWSRIRRDVRKKFRYDLRLWRNGGFDDEGDAAVGDGGVAHSRRRRVHAIALLRRVCIKAGVQLFARDFTGLHAHGPLPTPGEPVIRVSDVYNIVPVVKHSAMGEPALTDATGLHLLGRNELYKRNWTSAFGFVEEALMLQYQVCGAAHPEIGVCCSTLALIIQRAGDAAGATAQQQRAAVLLEKLLGVHHHKVVTAHAALAQYLANLHDPSAVWYMRRVIYLLEMAAGPDHPEVVMGYLRLATWLRQAKAPRTAILCAEEALKRCGSDPMMRATCLEVLATAQTAVGDYRGGLVRLRTALGLFKRICGEDHPTSRHTVHLMREFARAAVEVAKVARLANKPEGGSQ